MTELFPFFCPCVLTCKDVMPGAAAASVALGVVDGAEGKGGMS